MAGVDTVNSVTADITARQLKRKFGIAVPHSNLKQTLEFLERLVADSSFQMVPYGLTIEGNRYVESIRLRARFLKNCDWNLVLLNERGNTLRRFQGQGRDIETIFDGRQRDGQLIGGGEITGRIS